MQNTETPPSSADAGREVLHGKMLAYGFAASIIGLPVGIVLKMPIVWGLAILGILVGGLKLWMRRNQGP